MRIYKSKKVKRLGDIPDFVVNRGEINQTIFRKYISEKTTPNRMLKGVEIGRYCIKEKLSQGSREWFSEKLYIKSNSPKPIVLKRRIATQRITGVDERLRLVATIINPPCYFADSTNSITISESSKYQLEYLLAQLNSSLFQWRFKLTSSNNNVGTNEIEVMPFREIDFTNTVETKQHDEVVKLVQRICNAKIKLNTATSEGESSRIEVQCESLFRQIDEAVYELYGLTEEEIKIVEGQ